MSQPRIAFFGLGLMGTGMAKRLLGAGFPVAVYNRTAERAAPLAKEGAKVASSPRDAMAGAKIAISMVADDNASRGVWLGENGALAGAAAGTTLVESSTISVGWVRELARSASEKKCELIDAPVTGSKMQAAAGELNFLVGGSETALEAARPALSVMGRSMQHLGPAGSGALMKLINNFVCGVQAAALAEALALIERSGLDVGNALSVLTTGAPGSPLVKTFSERMATRTYTPHFHLRLMAKDLSYAIGEASQHSLDLSTAARALEVFNRAVQDGHGDEDISAVVEPLRKH
jgi:3-hydroxyisobutyrate dehydrogenase